MNLFEIMTVCKAIFDDDYEWTGAMEMDYVFAYDKKDVKEYEFMSKMNGIEAKIWE